MAELAPDVQFQEERVRWEINATYDATERNVLSGIFVSVPLSDEAKNEMRLLQLAYYNALTGQAITWIEAARGKITKAPSDGGEPQTFGKIEVHQGAKEEAKSMVKDFTMSVIRTAQKGTTERVNADHGLKSKFMRRFRHGDDNGTSGK